jgi:hypothetical protein
VLLLSVTSLYVTEIKTSFCPRGQMSGLGFVGLRLIVPEADPLWPAVTVRFPLSCSDSVNLLAALGHCCPPLRQPQVEVAVALAVIVSDAPAPSPAILNDTLRLPLLSTVELHFMKCAFWASTVIATKLLTATAARVMIFLLFIITFVFLIRVESIPFGCLPRREVSSQPG